MTSQGPIDMRSVTGKRVLVTAGASGIGLAIARAFAAAGAHVCACDVDDVGLASLSKAEPLIDPQRGDVADPKSVTRLFEYLADVWGGRMDVLVNNAGISGPVAPIEDVSWKDWQNTLAVNVGGMFLCIREAIPLLRANGGGTVINVSSSSARTGVVNRLPYVTSKVAVHGLTLNVARELGPIAISCNAILPGLVDNPRGRAFVEQYAAERKLDHAAALAENLAFISMRSVIDPNEIAGLCLHLASPAGRNISGQLIGVCGNAEWE
jgi:NAD(P)-dependent dehydrogenase (short-subunit alcohol dehydrogenase family)